MGYVGNKQNLLSFLSIFSVYLQQQGVKGLDPAKAMQTLIDYYND